MKENDAPRRVGELEPPPAPIASRTQDDPTILARWLYRAMEQGPLFWVTLGGLTVVLLGLSVVVSSMSAAKSVTSQAWVDLVPATSPEDQLKIADAHPKTPVADWARLQAAYEEYRKGLRDLTTSGKRESAGPRLKRALDLFSQVAREAPKDAPQSRGAAFAVARVLEARNELPEAIKQYRLVAETWKDSPEARQSIALVKTLEDPISVQFYKDLYTSTPISSATSPLIPPNPFIKPADPLSPGPSGVGKSFLPDLGPAGIDPPPPPSPVVPPPTATPSPTPTLIPIPEKATESPKAEAVPPAASTPK